MPDNLMLYSLLLCPLKASDMYFLRILGLNQKVNVRILLSMWCLALEVAILAGLRAWEIYADTHVQK